MRQERGTPRIPVGTVMDRQQLRKLVGQTRGALAPHVAPSIPRPDRPPQRRRTARSHNLQPVNDACPLTRDIVVSQDPSPIAKRPALHPKGFVFHPAGDDPRAQDRPTPLDAQLISQLVDRAQSDGIKLTGEGGLLQLTKRILESALEGEITARPGHEKHEKTASGNTRNGIRSKTVVTEVGPVRPDAPRDREGSSLRS